MNFKELLKNKKILYGVIGGAAFLLILIIVLSFLALAPRHNGDDNARAVEEKRIDRDAPLVVVDNPGKSLEIQALLARENIEVAPKEGETGSKQTLMLKKGAKMSDRDRALLAIVRSGIMDKNIGLEVFDKGDFTSSKEDKKIRLARAVNGELARLIKKIEGINDATVFVSIPPHDTMFTALQKPITATVQVSIDSGDKLDKNIVRAIKNLVVGSVQGLNSKNLSITDTNGNVYNSLDVAETDNLDALEENDQYMKKKVMTQLDRLVGKGNYVVTVSTYLREAPMETSSVIYDPKKSGILNEQRFSESLGDKALDTNKMSGATSTFLPGGLPNQNSSSNSRNYSRAAADMHYGVSKTQSSEIKSPGMIEEISIAVTLDSGALPQGMRIQDLKQLVARAANPKANPKNVTIAFSDGVSPIVSPDMPSQLPKPEASGNPWWTVAVILGIGLVGGLLFIHYRAKKEAERQQREIDELLAKSQHQQDMLKAAQSSIDEVLQNLLSGNMGALGLQQNLDNFKENSEDLDDSELAIQLKSWIESI